MYEALTQDDAWAPACKVAPATMDTWVHACKHASVIHFSGHGRLLPDSDGIVLEFEDQDARLVKVTPTELADHLRSADGSGPRLVVLAACHSAQAAQAFLDSGVPAVVCVDAEQEIEDTALPTFAQHFYRQLKLHHDVYAAFDSAKSNLLSHLHSVSERDRKRIADKLKLYLTSTSSRPAVPWPAQAASPDRRRASSDGGLGSSRALTRASSRSPTHALKGSPKLLLKSQLLLLQEWYQALRKARTAGLHLYTLQAHPLMQVEYMLWCLDTALQIRQATNRFSHVHLLDVRADPGVLSRIPGILDECTAQDAVGEPGVALLVPCASVASCWEALQTVVGAADSSAGTVLGKLQGMCQLAGARCALVLAAPDASAATPGLASLDANARHLASPGPMKVLESVQLCIARAQCTQRVPRTCPPAFRPAEGGEKLDTKLAKTIWTQSWALAHTEGYPALVHALARHASMSSGQGYIFTPHALLTMVQERERFGLAPMMLPAHLVSLDNEQLGPLIAAVAHILQGKAQAMPLHEAMCYTFAALAPEAYSARHGTSFEWLKIASLLDKAPRSALVEKAASQVLGLAWLAVHGAPEIWAGARGALPWPAAESSSPAAPSPALMLCYSTPAENAHVLGSLLPATYAAAWAAVRPCSVMSSHAVTRVPSTELRLSVSQAGRDTHYVIWPELNRGVLSWRSLLRRPGMLDEELCGSSVSGLLATMAATLWGSGAPAPPLVGIRTVAL